MLVLLRSTLEQLQEKDTAQIFAQPVNIKEVRHNSGAWCMDTVYIVAKWEGNGKLKVTSNEKIYVLINCFSYFIFFFYFVNCFHECC